MQAIFSAASGLKNQQTRIDTIASNISNTNTVGYKSTRVDFKDALYALMDNPVGNSEETNLLAGCGVLTGATTADFTAGKLMPTGILLDFAISGEGFFTVENSAGERQYTRNGNFLLSDEGNNNYLVTAQGYHVLDTAGNRIVLPEDISNLSVTGSGVLGVGNTDIAGLGIVNFSNPDGLMPTGDSCLSATENSGEPVTAGDPQVQQGSLEGSNVDLAQELTLLIRAQRAYSLSSKALKTADDMDALANTMR